jgi:hypothetical protein
MTIITNVEYTGGDISYATGYMSVWEFFLNMISPVASSVLYLTTVGNHESDYPNTDSYYEGTDSGGECGVIATAVLPQPYPASTNKPWWSYDIGLIHFIGMSTEHDFRVGSEQYLWLEGDLGGVNRTVTPWVIFGGHRAMYINSDWGDGDEPDIKSTSDAAVMDLLILHVEPLLFKHRVNLGFYGHNHVVQRHSAVFNKKVIQKSSEILCDGEIIYYFEDPQATVHMVIGTAGAGFTKNSKSPSPDWNEMWFYRWGYARVTAINSTYLDWEWVESSTGIVYDHMVITQTVDFQEKKGWSLSNEDYDDSKNKKTFSVSLLSMFYFFLFGYGFIFTALMICLFTWRITYACMNATDRGDNSLLYAKLTPEANDGLTVDNNESQPPYHVIDGGRDLYMNSQI